ncbi:MAG: hypothetical protein RSF40_01700 [Oscillospiraceae bacterium]
MAENPSETKKRYNPRAGQKKERDYKLEYEKKKQQNIQTLAIGASIPKTLNNDFIEKCQSEGKTKSFKIRELIEQYTYGDNS